MSGVNFEGLSGVTYNPERKEFYAISDDGTDQPPRFFPVDFSFDVNTGAIGVNFKGPIIMTVSLYKSSPAAKTLEKPQETPVA